MGRRAFLSSGVAALAAAKVACGGEADAGSAKAADPAKAVKEHLAAADAYPGFVSAP